jgi:hypothetical protein
MTRASDDLKSDHRRILELEAQLRERDIQLQRLGGHVVPVLLRTIATALGMAALCDSASCRIRGEEVRLGRRRGSE